VPTATCRSLSHWAANILLILFRSYWRSRSSRGRWRARYGCTSCFCRFVPQPMCRLNSAWLTKSQLGPDALSSSASQDLAHLCRTCGFAFKNTGRQCWSILSKYTVFIIGYTTHTMPHSQSSQAIDTLIYCYMIHVLINQTIICSYLVLIFTSKGRGGEKKKGRSPLYF